MSWSSIPWLPALSNTDAGGKARPIGWNKRHVPYVEEGTRLQTLDVWIPVTKNSPSMSPVDLTLRQQSGPWIVYIHGGAWRDPLVDSSSFERTATSLLEAVSTNDTISLAGIVSLNYRLSSHPKHPTHPAPSQDPNAPLDTSRASRHPDHIRDVLSAINFLQGLGVARDYILAGHSCGATLAFQVAMNQSRWGAEGIKLAKPRVLVGLNGLYDLAAFMKNPDESHKTLVPLYETFTRGAFGDDENAWKAVCPTVVQDWQIEWPEGEQIFLIQSKEDNLVPYSQLEIMKGCFEKQLALPFTVTELAASGEHNELWRSGDELFHILKKIILGRGNAASPRVSSF